jgi:hypothetical protein
MYKAYSCAIFTLLKKFQNVIEKSPKHCPIIVFGDFYIDILEDNNHAKTKQ